MQFVTNGPDIPDALLQAHEEGRVVFFCGAGISYPAGLPGFKGLVEEIYQLNGTTRRGHRARGFRAWAVRRYARSAGAAPARATPSRPPCADAGAETETASQGRHRYADGALAPGAQP